MAKKRRKKTKKVKRRTKRITKQPKRFIKRPEEIHPMLALWVVIGAFIVSAILVFAMPTVDPYYCEQATDCAKLDGVLWSYAGQTYGPYECVTKTVVEKGNLLHPVEEEFQAFDCVCTLNHCEAALIG